MAINTISTRMTAAEYKLLPETSIPAGLIEGVY